MLRSRNAATMISCVGSYIAIPFVSVPAKMLDRDYTHLRRGRGGNSCGVQLRASCTRAPSHGFCSLLGGCPRIRVGQNLTSQNAPESTIGNRRGVLLPPKMPIFAFLGQAP